MAGRTTRNSDNSMFNASDLKRQITNENANRGYQTTTVYNHDTPTTVTPKKTSTSTKSTTTTSTYGAGDYLASLYAQRQQAAQDAYDRSKALLDDAYNTASGNYANIYNRGVGQLGKSYKNSLGKINTSADDAFREAYVNKVLAEKNLSQRLAAMGMSGGASESAMSELLNNYGNARNSIQRTLDTNMGDLETDYNANLTNLYNAYQSQMAGLDQQRASQLASLLNNLNNQLAGASEDYFSLLVKNPQLIQQALGTATANMNAFAPAEQTVSNAINPTTVMQKNDMGDTATNYSRLVDEWLKGGGIVDGLKQRLINEGLDNQAILNLINNSPYFRG